MQDQRSFPDGEAEYSPFFPKDTHWMINWSLFVYQEDDILDVWEAAHYWITAMF